MALEERHSERFDDIGRVEIPELCGISATLENISKDGCKIHYSFPVVVDLENDYDMVKRVYDSEDILAKSKSEELSK
jgi:hypothetical protein